MIFVVIIGCNITHIPPQSVEYGICISEDTRRPDANIIWDVDEDRCCYDANKDERCDPKEKVVTEKDISEQEDEEIVEEEISDETEKEGEEEQITGATVIETEEEEKEEIIEEENITETSEEEIKEEEIIEENITEMPDEEVKTNISETENISLEDVNNT